MTVLFPAATSTGHATVSVSGAASSSHAGTRHGLPTAVPSDELFFWMRRWQEGEAESARAREEGDVHRFANGRDAADPNQLCPCGEHSGTVPITWDVFARSRTNWLGYGGPLAARCREAGANGVKRCFDDWRGYRPDPDPSEADPPRGVSICEDPYGVKAPPMRSISPFEMLIHQRLERTKAKTHAEERMASFLAQEPVARTVMIKSHRRNLEPYFKRVQAGLTRAKAEFDRAQREGKVCESQRLYEWASWSACWPEVVEAQKALGDLWMELERR